MKKDSTKKVFKEWDSEKFIIDEKSGYWKKLVCPKCKNLSEELESFPLGKKCAHCGTFYMTVPTV